MTESWTELFDGNTRAADLPAIVETFVQKALTELRARLEADVDFTPALRAEALTRAEPLVRARTSAAITGAWSRLQAKELGAIDRTEPTVVLASGAVVRQCAIAMLADLRKWGCVVRVDRDGDLVVESVTPLHPDTRHILENVEQELVALLSEPPEIIH